jgi:SNF2 family DNA or RNA helicase
MTAVETVLEHYKLPFELRTDQVEDVNYLCLFERGGAYLPVGSGKTVVATMVALYACIQNKTDQILILAPPILLAQWERWVQNFEGLTTTLYRGTPLQRKDLALTSDVIITTPGLLKNDFTRLTEYFGPKRVFVIVDEATCVRAPGTLIHKALRDLMNTGSKMLCLLTGTTISSPWQCYGYLALIVPGVYRDYRQFTLIHITGTDPYGTPSSYQNLDLLARNMRLQAVRREAEDILDLPDVAYVPVVYDLTPGHLRLYNKVIEDLLVELDNGDILDALIPQRLRITSQRIILRPVEFGGEKIVPAGFALIDDFLGDLEGEKLIIYASFQSSNEAITDYCTKLGESPALVYGGVRSSAKKNLEEVARFKSDSRCRVMVGNPRSAGVGLDGLQNVCRAMLFLELPVPADFLQAVGRIKRTGQTKKCVVKIAVANRTIQVDLQRCAMKKEDLTQKVVPTKETLRRALMGS